MLFRPKSTRSADAAGRLGERTARLFDFEPLRRGGRHFAALESIDRDPARSTSSSIAPALRDHAGGNELVPNATLVVQKAEWQAARKASGMAAKVGIWGRCRPRPLR